MATRVQYAGGGYVMARRVRRMPRQVPKTDVILFRLRGRRKVDIYMRPDEAVAIITVLSAEVWEELVP